MTLPTVRLTAIADKWCQAIKNSTAINEYCQLKYGKLPKIYKSINGKKPPEDKDCPYIIVFIGKKTEGLGEPEYQYHAGVAWAIFNNGVPVEVDGIFAMPGNGECEDLGQLIWQEIAEVNPSYPVSTVDFDLDNSKFFPQFPGWMHVTLTITPTYGQDLEY